MKYVHYWHFNQRWYALVNDNQNSERVYWHNSADLQDIWNEKYLIPGSECMTKREVKGKLTQMYPGYILVKDRPFHEGRRWYGNKVGSR